MTISPVAGIDVSKEYSDFCILTPDRTVFSRGKVFHHPTSMDKLIKQLEDVENAFDMKPVCIMESTAYYHRILYRYLTKHKYKVIVINALQSKAASNFNIRSAKTDKIDAYKLATMYGMTNLKPSIMPSKTIQELRDLCRNHNALEEQLVVSEERLRAYVEQTLPGFVKVFSRLGSKSSLTLLSYFASKEEFNEAGFEKIAEIITKVSRSGRNWSEIKAQMILTSINNGQEYISTPSHSAIIKSIAITIMGIKEAITENDNALELLFELNETLNEDRTLLMTIPGVGKQTAAVLIGETGNFDGFRNYRQLAAYYGLDPNVNKSGTVRKKHLGISKKGSSLVRKMLRMAVQNSVYRTIKGDAANPVLAKYFDSKKETKPPKVAEIAAMRKLTAIIFAVMRDRQPFELRLPEEHIAIMGIDSDKKKKISA